jgi:uncharacterized membrane protein YozB (DUF420 family)
MQTQSFLIVALMLYGISQHRNRQKHAKIMYAAMIWDVILILQIELSRGAIMKASKAMVNPVLLNIHVSIAVSTVVLYGFMIFLGRKVIAGDNTLLKRHKRLGQLTMVMRILTFATSFLAVPEVTL